MIGAGMAVAPADWLGAALAYVGGTAAVVGGTAICSVGLTKRLRVPPSIRELIKSSSSPRGPTMGSLGERSL